MDSPTSVHLDGTRLFVADYRYHRVTIWNSVPTTNGQAADRVLGQTTFATLDPNAGGLSASSLNEPYGLCVRGTRLYVADSGNSRVLVWTTLPTANKQAANLVLGQPDFTSGTSINGGMGPASMAGPGGLLAFGGRLYATDPGLNRILVWSSFPTDLMRQPADQVLGQPDFASANSGTGAASCNGPSNLATDGRRLFAADAGNKRLLVWSSWPAGNGQPASGLLGQDRLASPVAPTAATAFSAVPQAVAYGGNMLWVLDSSAQRVLGYKLSNGPRYTLAYSRSTVAVGAGPLTITATFTDAIASTPTLTVDRPGSGNDLTGAPMTQTAAQVWRGVYDVAPTDGVDVLDGVATVTVGAHDTVGNAADPPANTTFTVNTNPLGMGSLVYSNPGRAYGTETLTLTATFAEDITPAVATVSIAGGSPSTANDVADEPMTPAGDRRTWTYSRALAGNAADDGTFGVTVTASGVTGTTQALRPPNGRFEVATASLRVRSVAAGPTRISRGQTAAGVLVTVENAGHTTAGLDFSQTRLLTGGSGYSFTATGPASVAGGERATCSVDVTAGSQAPLGPTTLDAVVSGTELGTGAPLSDSGADQTDTWFVERPARLELVSVTSASTRVVRGRSSALATLSATNTGEATAVITAAGLTFNGGQVGYGLVLASGPETLPGGATATFSFDVTVTSTAPLGQTTVDGFVVARDSNDPSQTTSSSQAASPHIWVVQEPLLASIAAAVTAPTTRHVALQGAASSAEETAVLVYHWSFASLPPASLVTDTAFVPNHGADAARTGFLADTPGAYGVQLVVADGTGATAAASASVVLADTRPTARATAPAEVAFGLPVILDGQGSSDPTSLPLAYSWRFASVPGGSRLGASSLVPNDGRRAGRSSFVPDVKGEYEVTLSADNGTWPAATPATLRVAAVNRVPAAALPASPVAIPLGQSFDLDGRASTDPNPGDRLTYHWSLASAPALSKLTTASLTPNDAETAGLVRIMPDVSGVYRLGLRVTDPDDAASTAQLELRVGNTPPTARVSATGEVTRTAPIVLDGSSSSDAETPEQLVYRWRFASAPSGSRVTTASLTPNDSPHAGRTAFVADRRGAYRVELVGQAPAAPVVAQATLGDDSRFDLPLPLGLTAGTYEVRVTASGRTSTGPGPRLQVRDPRVLRMAPGENALLEFDASHDQVGTLAGVQAAAVLTGAALGEGAVGLLVVTRSDAASDAQVVTTRAARTEVMFPPVTLAVGRSFVFEVRAASWERLARAVVTSGGPPVPLLDSDAVHRGAPQLLRLDAGASRGVARPLAYRWRLAASPPGAGGLAATAPTTTYRTGVSGRYAIRLQVSDARGVAATASLDFDVANIAPQAFTRPQVQLILPDVRGTIPPGFTGSTVVLDGRGSVDVNGEPLTYLWEVVGQPEASRFVAQRDLEGARGPLATLRLGLERDDTGAYTDAGDYLVKLTVTDPAGARGEALVELRVSDPAKLVPAADAGLDRTVDVTFLPTSPPSLLADLPDPTTTDPASRVDFVRLDGRESADPNTPPLPLDYRWRLLSAPAGSAVTGLADHRTAFPRFRPDRPGTYRFQLVVENGRYFSAPASVGVLVRQRQRNLPPAPVARLVPRPEGARPFVCGRDRVALDGAASADPDPEDRLTYRWLQLAGPSVQLAPAATSPQPTFVPLVPGQYAFRLHVTDRAGLEEASDEVRLSAIAADDTPPRLTVVASTATGATTGEDFEPLGLPSRPRSLRTRVGDPVTLAATAVDPDVGRPPLDQKLLFTFRQVAGPTVVLVTTGAASALEARAEFVPTTSRVHVFEVAARQLSSRGIDTGVHAVRQVRVIVDSTTNGVPIARIATAKAKEASGNCPLVSLSGASSSDEGPNPSSQLLYRWVQVGGPPLALSSPYSAVLTFVAPDFPDDLAREYRFQLFVDDGHDRSEPDVATVVLAPDSARTGELPLSPGLNLASLPIDAGGWRVSDLVRRTGSRLAVGLTDGGPGAPRRFAVMMPELGGPDPLVAAGDGWLLIRPRTPTSPLGLAGHGWRRGGAQSSLARGLNLVSYPRGVPDGEDALALLARTGGTFAVTTAGGRWRACIPGLPSSFPIREGQAYLLWLPSSRTVTLPGCR